MVASVDSVSLGIVQNGSVGGVKIGGVDISLK